MEDTAESVLFVFYSFNEKNSSTKDYTWSYKKFPKGWEWTGAGSTQPIRKDKKKVEIEYEYKREEQFNGPKETRYQMICYLDTFFKKLKDNEIVLKYKIRQSYKP